MKWFLVALVVLIAAGMALSLFVRTRAVPDDRIAYPDKMWEPGNHDSPGGFVAVRRVEDADAAFRRLAQVVMDAPRTELRDGGPDNGRMVVVTRTPIMGFPDVTQIWTKGDLLSVRGHLVIGKGDMGVNRRRVLGWLDAADLNGEG